VSYPDLLVPDRAYLKITDMYLSRRNIVLIGCAVFICWRLLRGASIFSLLPDAPALSQLKSQMWHATSDSSFPSVVVDSDTLNLSVSNVLISPFPSVVNDSETLNVSVSNVSSYDPLPLSFDDSAVWCKHLSSTPEPPLVVYNRIPKAGGTTMKAIYQDKLHRALGMRGFTNRNNLKDKLLSTFSAILETSKEGTTTIVDGHFRPMFPVPNATFMNLMRLPKSRVVSNFYYSLYDSVAAKHSDNGVNKKFLENVTSPALNEKCLKSKNCLKWLRTACRSQIQFLSTSDSWGEEKTDGTYDKIDIGKILSNKNLEVLGFQEEFEKSLDMFECAFPSIFEGARQKLKGIGSKNKGKHKFGITSKNLEKLIDENFCVEEMELYRRALDQFNYRYTKMMMNRDRCCRVKRN